MKQWTMGVAQMNENRYKVLQYIAVIAFLAIVAACIPFIKWGDLDPVRTLGLVAVVAFFESWRIQFPWGRPLRLGMAATLCIIAIRPMPEVVVRIGWVANHTLRLKGRQVALADLAPPGTAVALRPKAYSWFDLWKGRCIR